MVLVSAAGCADIERTAADADRWIKGGLRSLGAPTGGAGTSARAVPPHERGPVGVLKAGAPGPAAAQLRQGILELERPGGDPDKAADRILAAAEAGNADAQYLIGITDALRPPDARDPAAADRWLARAAVSGHRKAQTAFADRLAGDGDDALANVWYERAARRGDPEAAFRLALRQIAGVGGPRNEAAAYRWLNVAVAQGHPNAGRYQQALAGKLPARDRSRIEVQARSWRPITQDSWPDPPLVRYRNLQHAAN